MRSLVQRLRESFDGPAAGERPALRLIRGDAEHAQPAEETEEALVREVLSAKEAPLRRLVARYRGDLLRVIERVLRLARRSDGAEDILQQVLLELFRKDMRLLRTWDPQKGRSLRSYLCKLAERRAYDALRGRRDRMERSMDDLTLEALVDLPHEALARQGRTQRFAAALDAFRGKCRDDEWSFFSLCFIEEQPIRDIAQALAISEPTAHQRRYRLRQRLLEELDRADD